MLKPKRNRVGRNVSLKLDHERALLILAEKENERPSGMVQRWIEQEAERMFGPEWRVVVRGETQEVAA